MALVITTCTNRKRKQVSRDLRMSALPGAELHDLARQWACRLKADPTRFRAGDIYGGRGFKEAVRAAGNLDARLLVVSAGLGLIDVSTAVPPYACTVLSGAVDSVRSRVIGDFDVAGWWHALCGVSPFAIALHDVAAADDGLICAALSVSYIEMIAADLLALPGPTLSRLRLFTRAPPDRVPAGLRPSLMPYDDRLDGADSTNRGTRSDFAGRALQHFAGLTRGDAQPRSAAEHAVSVLAALHGWRLPARVNRVRRDDAGLLAVIRDHWDAERGSSSRLLRRLRDDLGIACEQGRFAELARVVRSEQA